MDQSCILCPNEGGAFKQTTNGEWAHLLCAIWVPETRVANDTLMEPITGVDKINKQRWKLVRYCPPPLKIVAKDGVEMLAMQGSKGCLHTV